MWMKNHQERATMEQTIHILVVDDEPDIRRILHIMLEHQG